MGRTLYGCSLLERLHGESWHGIVSYAVTEEATRGHALRSTRWKKKRQGWLSFRPS